MPVPDYDAAMANKTPDYDSPMGGAQKDSAQAQNVGASAIPPEQAASALKIAPQANVPIATALPDPAAVKGMVDQRNRTAISSTSPAMQRWSAGNPAHVAASQDQYPWLNEFSNVWKSINQALFVQPGENRSDYHPSDIVTDIGKEFGLGVEDIGRGLNPSSPVPNLFSNDVEAAGTFKAGQVASGALSALWSPLVGAYEGSPGAALLEKETGFRREATGQILSMLTPLGADVAASKFREPPIDVNLGPRPLTGPPEGTGDIIEGEFRDVTPPSAIETHAEMNGEVLDAMHSTVSNSELQARSSETMQEFIRQQTEGTPTQSLSISPQAISEAYNKAGIVPHANDGILGWVPDISAKISAAINSGHDLVVPTDGYMTNVSDQAHAALRNGISVADQPSINDAKEVASTQAEPLKAEGLADELTKVPAPSPEVLNHIAESSAPIAQTIAKVQEEQYLHPIFKDAASAGMTEPQFKLYSKQIEAAQSSIYERMYSLVQKQIEKENTSQWKAKADELRPAITAEINSRPGLMIRHFLSEGELPDGSKPFAAVKLDRGAVKEAHPDLIDDLPKSIFGANGVGADDLAEAFGFRNGESMLRAIDDAERVRKTSEAVTGKKMSVAEHAKYLVKLGTDRAVRAELGDLLSDKNIEAEVNAAVQAPPVQSVLTAEMNALATQAGLPFDREVVERHAKEQFEKLPVKEAVKVKNFERYVGKYGRQAEIALLRKKPIEAFKAKQYQLINNKMLTMSHELVKEYTRFAKSVVKWREPTVSSISQEYLNYIHASLATMGLRVKRVESELVSALGGKSAESFANEKNAEGDEILYVPLEGTSPKDMNVSTFQDMNDYLTSLAANGKNAQEILTHRGRMELQDAINRSRDQFEDRKDKKTLPELVDKNRFRAGFDNALAPMISIEFMTNDLDGELGINGVYTEALMRPLQEAFGNQSKELREFADHLNEFASALGKDFNKSLDRGVEVPLNFTDLHGESLPAIKFKKNLLTAALHYGSETGRMKLLKGFGWGNKEEAVLRTAFDKYLGPNDIRWLNHMWEYGAKQWPKVEAFTRRVSGVASAKMEPLDFKVNGTNLRGGYAPIVYDKRLTPFADKDQPGGNTKNLFGSNYSRATTPRGYTKARTGYVGPIDLDPASLYTKYVQAIHDMSMREAIVSAQRFVTNQNVSANMRKSMGNEYYKQIAPWMQKIAGAVNTNDGLEGLSRLSELGRHMLISANLAYHISTVVMHGLTAGAKSLQDMTNAGAEGALKAFLDDPKGFADFNRSKSEFLKSRKVDRDQNQLEQFERMTKTQGAVDQVIKEAQDLGFVILRASDNLSAHIQWRAKYEESMADPNFSEEDAIYAADRAVRIAHGSGHDIDLPNLLSAKSPWVRSFTPFMTSRMNSLNRVIYSKDWKNLLANLLTVVGVAAAAYTGLHYNKKQSLPRQLITNGVQEGLGYVPFLSALVYGTENASKVQLSILDDAAQIFADFARHVKTKFEQPYKHEPLVEDVLRAAGVFTGGVSGALARPAQYLTDVATGQRHPQSVGEFAHDILLGPKPKGQ